MKITGKRLRNILSNKILQKHILPYGIFFIQTTLGNKQFSNVSIKTLNKVLIQKNFLNLMKEVSVYPIKYIPCLDLLQTINTLKLLIKDKANVLVCSIKIPGYYIQDTKLIQNLYIGESAKVFYVLYTSLLLNHIKKLNTLINYSK